MGKTRIEELCYELYGSWNQHDSWHRYAMIRELRELMKQPKGGSDHFERFGDDRRIDGDDRRLGVGQFRDGADDDDETWMETDWWYRSEKKNPEYQICKEEELPNIETEVATDPIETEHGTGSLVPEAQEEKSTSQFQVSIANSEIVRSIEPGMVDLGLENEDYVVLNENLEQEWDQKNTKKKTDVDGGVERDQNMISNTNTGCAHKVLVKMPSKEKRIKHLKGWKFKFKRMSLVGIMLQIEQYKLSKRRRRMYHKLSTNIKDESMKVMSPGNHLRMLRHLHNSRVQCKMRMMNDSWSMRQPTLKIMKSHRKHKWKSKHFQIASNFWITHSHKLADLVLRTALTDWKAKNSKGSAYDGCVSLEIKFAGFGRGKTEMLASSQKMQQMDLFSLGIHTEMEENVELHEMSCFLSEESLVGFVGYKAHGKELLVVGVKQLTLAAKKFYLKHKWRPRLLQSFSELKQRIIMSLWKSLGFLMEDVMEEDLKQQGNSEPLEIVPDVDAKVELVWESNSLVFHFKTRVWDPGGKFLYI